MSPLTEDGLAAAAAINHQAVEKPYDSDNSDSNHDLMEASGDFSISVGSEAAAMTAKQQAALEERRQLAKAESRAIWWLRLLVVLVFVVMAVTTSVVVFFYIRNSEEDTFESEFKAYSSQVIDQFILALERTMNSVDALSIGITSHAIFTNATWPYVTVPDFEYLGSNARVSGGSPLTIFSPLVTKDLQDAWGGYSAINLDHVNASYIVEKGEKTREEQKFGLPEVNPFGPFLEILESTVGTLPFIYYPDENASTYVGDELPPPYLPIWQNSPVFPPGVNFVNMDTSKLPFLNHSVDVVATTGQASLSNFIYFDDVDNDEESEFDIVLKFGQYRHRAQAYIGDPLISAILYPVFDSFDTNRTVVGTIFSTLYWRMLFSETLPPHIHGIVVVLENTSGEQITFEIDGSEVNFMGVGDLHDTSFDNLGVSLNLQEYLKEVSSPETQSFTYADLDSEALTYLMHVYPSQEFKDIYVTSESTEQAVAVAAIFVVALCIFLVYDCCVRRRQRIVMDRAVKATAVVSSLFPEQVREQVINDDDGEAQALSKKTAFLNTKETEKATSRPIAEKFAECTVMYADLAGFTNWSSTRKPEEVFQLLETMFKAFDAVAAKRRVFKVETIGDSYMAVTGLPEPQPDHAIRMAKFAAECIEKLDLVTADLLDELGSGTDSLTLRIGMNSGEVTGGVLRGDKSRFQLFGETVDTANYMERTGVPRRLQCSQTTAEALTTAGKSSWLEARADTLVEEKGEIPSYFIQVPDKGDKSQGTSSGHQSAVDLDAEFLQE